VTAEFDTTPRPGVAVPAKAVFLSGNHHYVFVQEAPGSFARVQVKTDSENGGTVIVAEGLEVGQKVVIDGVLFLQQILQSKGPA